ncbi:protein mab-21-like 3 [Protopterus annectens]|uniref:protein mab-21-like 3 n=1 Tax=Protopterus annectens TaxID=7888 RepID=UPI001CFB8929|nr:protein mab-21-like 3 [Protopterus annectens]
MTRQFLNLSSNDCFQKCSEVAHTSVGESVKHSLSGSCLLAINPFLPKRHRALIGDTVTVCIPLGSSIVIIQLLFYHGCHWWQAPLNRETEEDELTKLRVEVVSLKTEVSRILELVLDFTRVSVKSDRVLTATDNECESLQAAFSNSGNNKDPVTSKNIDVVNQDKDPNDHRNITLHILHKDCITVCNHYQGTPALTLIVQQGNTETNVDLVPFIKDPYNYWHLEWPREGSTWPSAEKIDECKMMGVDLVAKETVFWRYSFSRIEKFLLEGIDADGGFRKASLRILKKIRIDYWESRFRKVLVSYHLKVILFWACENYPDSDFWCDLNTSFRRLVDDLIDYLSETNLPHYFVDEVNMFKTDNDSKLKLQELCEEVKKLRRNPEQYLSIED